MVVSKIVRCGCLILYLKIFFTFLPYVTYFKNITFLLNINFLLKISLVNFLDKSPNVHRVSSLFIRIYILLTFFTHPLKS